MIVKTPGVMILKSHMAGVRVNTPDSRHRVRSTVSIRDQYVTRRRDGHVAWETQALGRYRSNPVPGKAIWCGCCWLGVTSNGEHLPAPIHYSNAMLPMVREIQVAVSVNRKTMRTVEVEVDGGSTSALATTAAHRPDCAARVDHTYPRISETSRVLRLIPTYYVRVFPTGTRSQPPQDMRRLASCLAFFK